MALAIPQSVKDFFERVESDLEPIPDYEIGGKLAGAQLVEGLTEEQRKGARSEVAAFNFTSTHAADWGTHFGPIFRWTTDDGSLLESPSIKEIDEEIIEHWKQRSNAARHPVLKARYADLVWDFHQFVTKVKPGIEFARLAIDEYINCVNGKLYKDTVIGLVQGKRALQISIRINDAKRIANSRDALFRMQVQSAEEEESTIAPICLFDELYEKKNVPLSADYVKKIIDLLESELARCTNRERKEGFSPWNAKEVGERLARHYQHIGRRDEEERVVRCYGNAFEEWSTEANGMLGMNWLQSTAEDYRRHVMKDDSARAQIAGRQKGLQASEEMHELVVEVSIAQRELESYYSSITDGEVSDALRRIAVHFVPRTDDARRSLASFQKDSPLVALVGVDRISDGHISAKAGSVADDPDGRLYIKLGENISFHAPFLRGCLAMATTRHELNSEIVLRELIASPIFENDKRTLLSHGLEAYFKEDHISAISVLVPQIEQGLRVLLGLLGLPVNKPKKDGAMQLKTLNEMLRESAVVDELGMDVANYFTVLLADPRGWNLRNDLCHGLLTAESFRQETSDRVLHCLLRLAMLRKSG